MRTLIALFALSVFVDSLAANQGQQAETKFRNAYDNFVHNERDSAEKELRAAADSLQSDAQQADERVKTELEQSVSELRSLADRVKSGALAEKKQLEQAFAKAHYALAHDDYLNATEAWARKQHEGAVTSLAAAQVHINKVTEWAGDQMDAGAKEAIEEAGRLGDELEAQLTADVEGAAKKAGDEVGQYLEDFGGRMADLAESMRGKPKK